jgi:predicted phage tail component-like protein
VIHLVRSFSFNGTRNDDVIILKGKDLPAASPRQHNMLNIPKRPGALLMSTSTNTRWITLPIAIKVDGRSFSKAKEELSEWLTTDEPCPLVLDEDPERTYFALLDSIGKVEEYGREYAVTSIDFVCLDPYKYSDEKTISIPYNTTSMVVNIDNLGHAETFPKVTVNVKKKINFFAFIEQNDYFQIGQDGEVDVPKVDPSEIIMNDSMTSLTGWGQAAFLDNGYISGNIASDGKSFFPETYGTIIDPPLWQGPSLKKSIGQALTDFRMEALVELQNSGSKTGMLEIYLLDSSNRTVAKIGIEDRFAVSEEIRAKARIGETDEGKWIASDAPNKTDYWKDFNGLIRIERYMNRWTAYFTIVDKNGNHIHQMGSDGRLTYYDSYNEYSSNVTQVQVAFRIYPGTTRAPMKVNEIKVWKLNPPSEVNKEVPYIADVGDVIEIDHLQNTIKKNGEIVFGLKDFRSNFFPLKPGRNVMSILPSDAGDVTISFRERYL